jgi:hypothetical protein
MGLPPVTLHEESAAQIPAVRKVMKKRQKNITRGGASQQQEWRRAS